MSGNERASEKSDRELDDVLDRDEIRARFDMLLQEVRVVLPGVQVLSAFLLTAPFSQRFESLDPAERWAYGIALTTSMLSVICLLGPTLAHRLGERTARSQRLSWSIRTLLAGLALLGVAVVSALWGVTRFTFGPKVALAVVIPVIAVILVVWVIAPLGLRRHTVVAD